MKKLVTVLQALLLSATSFAQWATTGVVVAGGNGAGTNANQLNTPNSIFVASNGDIYVADYFNHRVMKWSPSASSGTVVAGNGTAGSSLNQLNRPSGVFVDASGNVYVAEQMNYRVTKWAPPYTSGVVVAGGNGSGTAANQLGGMGHIWVDGSANVYIADASANRVMKWSAPYITGTMVAGDGNFGTSLDHLSSPYGLYVDGNGDIYVSENGNFRVTKWNGGSTGTLVAGSNGQLGEPGGIRLDANKNLFVADAGNHRVMEWMAPSYSTGIPVAGTGTAGSNLDQLSSPFDVAFDASGNLYVCDNDNHRVLKYGLTGVDKLKATVTNTTIFPNPASGAAEVSFDLAGRTDVRIECTDATGRLMFTADHQKLDAGQHLVPLPVSSLANGVYNIKLTAGGGMATAKLVVSN